MLRLRSDEGLCSPAPRQTQTKNKEGCKCRREWMSQYKRNLRRFSGLGELGRQGLNW
jgi:hypothetical protein